MFKLINDRGIAIFVENESYLWLNSIGQGMNARQTQSV